MYMPTCMCADTLDHTKCMDVLHSCLILTRHNFTLTNMVVSTVMYIPLFVGKLPEAE